MIQARSCGPLALAFAAGVLLGLVIAALWTFGREDWE